jgi:hypothetical protein
MLMSINTASTKPTKHTEDMDKAEDEALAYTKKTVQEIHTAGKDTGEARKIEHSGRRSATSVTNQAAGQQNTLPRC